MKKFIINTTVFSAVCISCFLYILSHADGYTDPFYIRFTTPKQESLIIGTSRAAQGLQPEVINDICNTTIYNYAFTMLHSPYGETYFNSIKKKLKKKTNTGGVFILTIDPWSISSKNKFANNPLLFEETKLCLGNTSVVNMNPNFFYLINNFRGKYYSILTNKNTNMFLHKNGWLEVSIDMDSLEMKKRTDKMVEDYKKNNLPNYVFSKVRLNYLKKTIQYLNAFGEVYLVRLPINNELLKIENTFMPNFNDSISPLISLTKGYLDMTPLNNDYLYTDGNHLHKTSGKKVSTEIANWINAINKKNN